MKKINRIFPFVLLAMVLISCGDKPFFEENKEIKGNSWSWDEPVEFSVDVQDTLNAYNFYLNIRTTTSYEYSNMYVFFNMTFPDGRTRRDTVPCPLADDFGNWYGKPSGSLVDNKILFALKRIFPVPGTYNFSIEQGMRSEELGEVTDIGLKIEKAKR